MLFRYGRCTQFPFAWLLHIWGGVCGLLAVCIFLHGEFTSLVRFNWNALDAIWQWYTSKHCILRLWICHFEHITGCIYLLLSLFTKRAGKLIWTSKWNYFAFWLLCVRFQRFFSFSVIEIIDTSRISEICTRLMAPTMFTLWNNWQRWSRTNS